MRYSKFFIPTQKENPSDAKIKSHMLMIKSGMIRQETSGIYSWLPYGFRLLQKIIKVIENFHEAAGVNQILMPTIQSAEIWKKKQSPSSSETCPRSQRDSATKIIARTSHIFFMFIK